MKFVIPKSANTGLLLVLLAVTYYMSISRLIFLYKILPARVFNEQSINLLFIVFLEFVIDLNVKLNVHCCSDEKLTCKKGHFRSGIFDEIYLLRLASEHNFPFSTMLN